MFSVSFMYSTSSLDIFPQIFNILLEFAAVRSTSALFPQHSSRVRFDRFCANLAELNDTS